MWTGRRQIICFLMLSVVRCLVRRYITEIQRKSQDESITEDDINEVRQDISSFRYELINILKMNDMKTPAVKDGDSGVFGKKSKDLVGGSKSDA